MELQFNDQIIIYKNRIDIVNQHIAIKYFFMVVGFKTTYAIVSSNPTNGKVYSIQHYVIKFVSDLRQVFSPGTPVSSTNKTDHHDITEILLKLTLDTQCGKRLFANSPKASGNFGWRVRSTLYSPV